MAVCASTPYATERELALVQLLGDSSLSRAEEADLSTLADACLSRGRARAAGYSGCNPEDVMADCGYDVLRLTGPAPGSRKGFHLCAMTRAVGRGTSAGTVELYVDEIGIKFESLHAFGVCIDQEDLERLHLAHELFHVLEYGDGRMSYEEMPPVRIRGMLGWRSVRPKVSSEVAAHAFARCVTNSGLSAQLVDALALIGEGSLTYGTFVSCVDRARAMLMNL